MASVVLGFWGPFQMVLMDHPRCAHKRANDVPQSVGEAGVEVIADASALAKSLRQEVEQALRGLDVGAAIKRSLAGTRIAVPGTTRGLQPRPVNLTGNAATGHDCSPGRRRVFETCVPMITDQSG